MNTPWGVKVSDGALEAIKWLALLLMLADHINTYIFFGSKQTWYELGRLAFPLFGFVIAYNLSRVNDVAALKRIAIRLLAAGTVAQLAYALLRGGLPLNIMFLFLVAVLMIWVSTTNSGWIEYFTNFMLLIVGGFFVEFYWFGVLYVWACWRWCRYQTLLDYALAMTALLSLIFVNNNLWALAAAPIILFASRVHVDIPRIRYFFYAAYPIHLCAIATWVKFIVLKQL